MAHPMADPLRSSAGTQHYEPSGADAHTPDATTVAGPLLLLLPAPHVADAAADAAADPVPATDGHHRPFPNAHLLRSVEDV